MSDVYEIYDYKWDSKTEIMYIEAEVSDSILACRATQYEPEQWTHGRCYVEVLWPDDDLVPAIAESKESLLAYCNNTPDIEWTLISLDNSIEEAQLCDVL
mgnify:FL=1|tara:strand:- start:24 stop:323 length:300 start_codon:yes stop_codon:yes gene_type:complete